MESEPVVFLEPTPQEAAVGLQPYVPIGEPRQGCQVDGCAGSWPQSENWSGRWQCDDCMANDDTEPAGPPDRAVESKPVTGPAPLAAGTFALYPTGDGGLVLVTDVEGRGVERRAVPGALLRMMGAGKMGRLMSGLFGG